MLQHERRTPLILATLIRTRFLPGWVDGARQQTTARVAVCLLLLLPGAANAESATSTPETLLSADSVLYFRFDGAEAHRAAVDRSAFGSMMKGDLGDLVDQLGVILKDSVGPAIGKRLLLRGEPVEQLSVIRSGFDHLPAALAHLGRHGLAIGLEVIALKPIPHIQITIVLPNAAQEARADILSALRLIPAVAEVKHREYTLEGRTIYEVPTKAGPLFRVTWWQEGPHVVFVAGTEGPIHAIATLQGKHRDVTANPLFQSLHEFQKYETGARFFIDVKRIGQIVRATSKEIAKTADAIGLGRLQTVTGQFRLEGRSLRTTLVITRTNGDSPASHTVVAAGTALDLSQLPPLPREMSSVSAFDLDLAQLYDAKAKILASVVPGGRAAVLDYIGKLNRTLGIDLQNDLFRSLGSTIAVYNSPTEGPFGLGACLAIRVKDRQKLEGAIDELFKSLPAALGADVSVKKESYHGVTVSTVSVVLQGFPFSPAFAVHDGWLVVAAFPQPVHGFILRSRGESAAWRPDDVVSAAILAARETHPQARVLSISVSDPRAALTRLTALAPLVVGTIESFAPGSFDLRRLPNADSLGQALFPSVSVTTDDGSTIRMEGRFAIPVPFALLDPAELFSIALELARLP
jgi:hypothetical protein